MDATVFLKLLRLVMFNPFLAVKAPSLNKLIESCHNSKFYFMFDQIYSKNINIL